MYVSLWNLGRVVVGAACLAGVVSVLAPAAEPAVKEAGAKEAAAKEAAAKAEKAGPAWTSLFDGKTLGKWKPTEFGGQGEVTIKDGAIYLATGNDLTGITWSGKDWPKMNYEISLDAQRVDGTDFFCGLTFAVNQDPCSLIVGGWGGTVVGISSLDGLDAYNNNTTKIVSFKKGQWYHIRLRVTPKQLEAWIDNDKVVDADTTDKKIGIRGEVDASKPLGIATWQTTGAVKNIRFRQLPEEKAQK
ncbi:MAG TPA: DUF1080 domain-containing protein [Pirellulales bacterium]|nr:DUF1080 domain-containing protein [Pirellulales bacterium]